MRHNAVQIIYLSVKCGQVYMHIHVKIRDFEFNIIPIKIPLGFAETWQAECKMYMKEQKTKNRQDTQKEESYGKIYFPDTILF